MAENIVLYQSVVRMAAIIAGANSLIVLVPGPILDPGT